MELQVIGAGFGRTGTMSMKLALERLGLGPCHHMLEVFAHEQYEGWAAAVRDPATDLDPLLDGYRSSLDFPSCVRWAELAERCPDAKVLLTVRSAESWWASFDATIGPSMRAMRDDPGPGPLFRAIDEVVFDDRSADRDTAVAAYEAHNRDVVARCAADRLLVYEVGSGWDPLCAFLGVEVPDEPFPRTNTTEEFLTRSAGDDGGS